MTVEVQEPRDAGLSLIELIVAVVISSFLLAGVAMVFINSWNTQEDVMTTTEATARGQLVASTIERAMRNANDYVIQGGGTILLVRTSLGGSQACQGFDLGAGQARMSVSAGPIASHWAAWEDGIQVVASAPFFAPASRGITYTFDIGTASAPVRFEGNATARIAPSGGGSPCW